MEMEGRWRWEWMGTGYKVKGNECGWWVDGWVDGGGGVVVRMC